MTAGETKLIFPGLAGFYKTWRDISYTLVRVIIGYNLFMHGWVKVTGAGLAGVSGYMAKQGLEPSSAFAAAAMVLETVGAACIALGLFTRFFAAALAIELLMAFLVVHSRPDLRSAKAATNTCCCSASCCSLSRSAAADRIRSIA